MKNFLPVLIMLLAINLFAQSTHTIDFEPAGVGSDWNWIVGENDDNPPLEFVANPAATGINTTPTVAKFTARVTGQPYALCFTDDDGEFTFDASNSTVKIMVYKPVVSNIDIKFEGVSAPVEIQIPNTVINQWEELTFDFSSAIGNTYSRIIILPDFDTRTQENIIYFDNILVPDGVISILPEPTVAAPTPTQDPGDVISMFSDAYTDVPVDTWLTVWSVGNLEDVLIAGNPTKKYTSVNFVGIETTGANLLDVTGMTHFHIDIWSPDNNDFKVKLVDFGADGVYGGGDDTEHEIVYTAPASETWISYDIPLSSFTNLNITGHMAQYILSKPNLGTMFVDNVYFYNSTAPTEPNVAAPTPTQASENVLSIYSDAYTNVAGTNFNPNWGQQTVVTVDYLVAGDNTLRYENLNYQGTQLANQDVSGYEFFHVDFWTANSTSLNFYLVSPGPVETPYALPITPNSWVSVDIPLSAFAPVDLTNIFQFKIDGNGDIWFDNWYFWKYPSSTVWTGNIDNNWHEAGNWSNGIPGSTTDVIVPSGLTNYPTVGAAAECNNITLESDVTGTATLVDDGNLTVNGTATVQRYYPTGGSTMVEWHLISSPVSDATAGMYTGYYLQWYQESSDAWNDIISIGDPMTSLQGFAFYAPNDGMTFNYTGSPGDGTYNLPISASGPVPEHWNLFGNPYPSALDWDLVAPANIANLQSGAVYYLDQATGTYLSYNGGLGGGSQFVPPGQGFFVSGANDGASFKVDNSMRTHSGGSGYYKANFDNMLVLSSEGNGYNDATYLRFDDEATTGIDKQFDAYKIIGVSNPELPQLYTISEDELLSINVLPQAEAVSAGFMAGVAGTYTISISEVIGMDNVVLEDLLSGTFTNLLSADYTFNYNPSDPSERFVIHFLTVNVPENVANMVNIYAAGNKVHVSLPGQTKGQATVYNTLGQRILASNVNGTSNLLTLMEAGIYIVNVNIDGQLITKKIIIE